MRRIRVIPTLLLNADGGLVKTTKFAKRTYIGDPINAVKIYNEKEVNELLLLDIDATREGREPRYDLIEDTSAMAAASLQSTKWQDCFSWGWRK